MSSPGLRVGVLTPHTAAGLEAELPAMTSGRAAALVAPIRQPGVRGDAGTASDMRSLAAPEVLQQAAAAIPAGSVDAVAHASVSTGYALGHRAEAAMVGRLRHHCGVPVAASCAAAVQALRTRGVGGVWLVHPPWFDAELNHLGEAYFQAQGFSAVASKANELPNDPEQIRPAAVVDWVCQHLGDAAEAVFLGGNGFRAAGAIEELERRTGRLILQSNQVLLWSILTQTAATLEVTGYGSLFVRSRS